MKQKEASILDVLDYLPSKVEKGVSSLMTGDEGGIKYPKFNFKGGPSLSEAGQGIRNKAVSGMRTLMGGPEGETNSKRISGIANKKYGIDISPDELQEVRAGATSSSNPLLNLAHDNARTRMIADPERSFSGMSISRLLAHAAQGGALGAGALTLPYIAKRLKEHKGLKDDTDDRYKRDRKKEAAFSFGREDLGDLYSGDFHPSFSHGAVPAAAVLTALGGFAGARALALKGTDKASDMHMDALQKKRQQELVSLMVGENQSQEDEVNKSAADNKFGSPSNAALLALWAFLTPAFYKFGQNFGEDTSDSQQYKKYVNALDKFEGEVPERLEFAPSKTGDLEMSQGKHLGTNRVAMPVPAEEKTQDPDIFV